MRGMAHRTRSSLRITRSTFWTCVVLPLVAFSVMPIRGYCDPTADAPAAQSQSSPFGAGFLDSIRSGVHGVAEVLDRSGGWREIGDKATKLIEIGIGTTQDLRLRDLLGKLDAGGTFEDENIFRLSEHIKALGEIGEKVAKVGKLFQWIDYASNVFDVLDTYDHQGFWPAVNLAARDLVKIAASAGGEAAGGSAGCSAGGWIGGLIGVAFAGVGAAPGAAIGCAIGTFLGGVAGSKLAEWLSGNAYDLLMAEAQRLLGNTQGATATGTAAGTGGAGTGAGTGDGNGGGGTTPGGAGGEGNGGGGAIPGGTGGSGAAGTAGTGGGGTPGGTGGGGGGGGSQQAPGTATQPPAPAGSPHASPAIPHTVVDPFLIRPPSH